MSSEYARERVRFGKASIEVEGPPEYVERRIESHLNRFGQPQIIRENGQKQKSEQRQLPGFENEDTPILVESIDVSENGHGNGNSFNYTLPHDLVTLYLEIFPEGQIPSQYEVISFITFYHQRYLNRPNLAIEDYKTGYTQLRQATVEEPEDLRSSVKNARTAKYLYSPQDGKFALTTKGEGLIQGLISKK